MTTNIKHFRKKCGLTQKELANKIGVSQNAVYNWETGKRDLSIDMIEKIANILDVTPNQLIGWEPLHAEPLIDEQETEIEHQAKQTEKELELRKLGYEPVDLLESRTRAAFQKLNRKGRKRAVEYVEDLTKIPEYRKDNSDQ